MIFEQRDTSRYKALIEEYSQSLAAKEKRKKSLSITRLIIAVLFIATIYFANREASVIIAGLSIPLIIIFGKLIHLFNAVKYDIALLISRINLLESEILFLEKDEYFADNGSSFIDARHPYSNDLDLYGTRSLYHFLNRCVTYTGKTRFAEYFDNTFSEKEILEKQAAVKELTDQLEFRNNINAIASLVPDSQSEIQFLKEWIKTDPFKISAFTQYYAFIAGPLFLILFFANIQNEWGVGSLLTALFFINLGFLARHLKKLNKLLSKSSQLNKILANYSLILHEITEVKWESALLVSLQKRLGYPHSKASQRLKSLSKVFDDLNSVQNPMGAVFSNGIALYHIHVLRKYNKWLSEDAHHILDWIDVIGELECLISLANYSYNNPAYQYPQIDSNKSVILENAGHPQIRNQELVLNSIDFNQSPFVILTGSNMAGKSTFLRTVATNFLIARMGAPVCAKHASIPLIPLLVSMRIQDSLNENESYFFAEVKRMKYIMDAIQEKQSFVLLDEILRGTNADDKRFGTIEVVKKLAKNKVTGVIATHDQEVCSIQKDNPEWLDNKCFEVDISSGKLIFDYKLKEGICQNQSASFWMKKNKII